MSYIRNDEKNTWFVRNVQNAFLRMMEQALNINQQINKIIIFKNLVKSKVYTPRKIITKKSKQCLKLFESNCYGWWNMIAFIWFGN